MIIEEMRFDRRGAVHYDAAALGWLYGRCCEGMVRGPLIHWTILMLTLILAKGRGGGRVQECWCLAWGCSLSLRSSVTPSLFISFIFVVFAQFHLPLLLYPFPPLTARLVRFGFLFHSFPPFHSFAITFPLLLLLTSLAPSLSPACFYILSLVSVFPVRGTHHVSCHRIRISVFPFI